jgi:hypothetical protein
LPKSGNIEGASIIMAPRKFSGPIQQGAIQVLRDMEVASTQEVARRRKKPRVSGAFLCGNLSPRSELFSVRASLPRVIQCKTGRFSPALRPEGRGFFDPKPDCSVVSPANAPHQYLDRDRYPPRALRRYSVPDARKTDAAYLCQRPFRPGVPTLSFR